MLIWTLAASVGLALVHLFAGKLYFLHSIPRSVWLSAAGGISVAYVFLHLLPELAEGQKVIAESVEQIDGHHRYLPYLSALAGLAVFYGLERMAKLERKEMRKSSAEQEPIAAVFWLHILSFSLYNMLVGYLLINRIEALKELGFFFIAIALHFLVNDFGLREHYRQTYQKKGRWILAAAVVVGWVAGWYAEVHEALISMITAFLVGVIILNVMKEELPEERASSFSAFSTGAVFYAAILLLST